MNKAAIRIKLFSVLMSSMIILAPVLTYSQDFAGLASDPRTPIFRSVVNPGYLLFGEHCFEFNLTTLGANLDNNMYFLERGTFKFSEFIENPNRYSNQMYDELQFFENTQKVKLNGTLRMQGPSLIFNPTDKYAFFLSSAFRMAGSTTGVPYHLAYLVYEEIPFFTLKNQWHTNDRSYVGSTMSWAEIGAGVAFDFTDFGNKDDYRLTGGIAVNSLFGYHGLHLRETQFDYLVDDILDVNVEEMNLTVLSSFPYDFYEREFTFPGLRGLGRGISFSLGLVFEKKLADNSLSTLNYLESYVSPKMNYRYRLGISLTDIGAIKFDRQANRVEFENASFTLNNPAFDDYDSFDHLLSVITDSLRRGEVRQFEDQPFVLGLPSALNMQFDYNLGNNFYAHLFLVQDLPLLTNRVARMSQIGIVPRYDFSQYSFALPITLNQFSMPRIGAYMRIGFFSIGTDSPGGWLGFNDMSGFDLYFSFNFGFNCPQKPKIRPCRPWN